MKIHQANVPLETVAIGEAVFVCTDAVTDKEIIAVGVAVNRIWACDYTWEAWRMGSHAPIQGIFFRRRQ